MKIQYLLFFMVVLVTKTNSGVSLMNKHFFMIEERRQYLWGDPTYLADSLTAYISLIEANHWERESIH
jgi:hypothetical protein